MNDHLDAETLAAWLDGSLATRERADAEAHAADCDRCRAVLAAMVRTEPPVTRRPWFALPAVRWMVPVATAAVALLVWNVAVDRRPADVPPADTHLAQAPVAPTSVEPAPSMRASEPRAVDAITPKGPVPPAPVQRRSAEPRDQKQVDTPAATPEAGARREAAPAPQTQLSRDMSERAAAAAPPPPAAPAQPLTIAAAEETRQRRMKDGLVANIGPRVVATADTAVRWRFGAAGLIEHSANGGKTWTPQPSGVTVELLAGAAPGPDVCWIVGRAGVVLRSTDRRTWQRIGFPETVDLTGVSAVDAQTAAVTAVDGRVFRTTDGGRTWFRGS